MKKIFLQFIILSFSCFAQSNNASITIYKDGFGLVSQPIDFQLKSGSNKVIFSNIPHKIDFNSILLSMDKVFINYQEYIKNDLGSILYLDTQIGKNISISTKDGKEIKGSLINIEKNWLSIRSGGKINFINIDDISLIESSFQKNYSLINPTIEWDINVSSNGKYRGELIYVSKGFDWISNYQLIMEPDEFNATLVSRSIINNSTNLDYANLKVNLVEGNLKLNDDKPIEDDYVIYNINKNITLNKNDEIITSLFPEKKIKFNRTYTFENTELIKKSEPLLVEISFENDSLQINNIIPSGKLNIYQKNKNGKIIYKGENIINQIDIGEKVILKSGRSDNVLGTREIVNIDKKKKSEEVTILIELKNNRNERINVKIIEHIFGNWVIREPSHDYRKTNSNTIEFDLTIEALKTESISYTYIKDWL
tara:strand:+ start:2349 stop:3620 length:1272 start_codon:yes stop_codon:yes gene_type:complete